MNFLGLFVFQAPFLPIVILGVGTLLGQSPVHDMLGLLAGHLYWFFADVYPEIRPGREWLSPPRFVRALFDPPTPVPEASAVPIAHEQQRLDVQHAADNEEPAENRDGGAKVKVE